MSTTANTDTYLIRTLLARHLPILREAVPILNLVRTDFGAEAREKGDTITIPVSASKSASSVTPAETDAAPSATAVTRKTVSLDKWYYADFHLSDQDRDQIVENENFIPMETEEAFRALCTQMNSDLLATANGEVYNFTGTAGTAPFGTPGINDAIDVFNWLDVASVPQNDRALLLDSAANAAAKKLDEIHHTHIRGSDETIRTGQIGHVLGADWYFNYGIPYHTQGTISDGDSDDALVDQADVAVGDTTVDIDESTLTGTVLIGDIFTVAGDTQTYAVTANATAASNAIAAMAFTPAAKVAWADDAAVAFKGSYRSNLAFQKNAFALVNRPLMTDNPQSVAMRDPVTGLIIRLTKRYQWMQTAWYFDVLYGVECIDPARAAILAG